MVSNVENRLKKGQGIGVFMEQAIQNAEEWGFSTRELLMFDQPCFDLFDK